MDTISCRGCGGSGSKEFMDMDNVFHRDVCRTCYGSGQEEIPDPYEEPVWLPRERIDEAKSKVQ